MKNPPASNNPSRTILPTTHPCPSVLKKAPNKSPTDSATRVIMSMNASVPRKIVKFGFMFVIKYAIVTNMAGKRSFSGVSDRHFAK